MVARQFNFGGAPLLHPWQGDGKRSFASFGEIQETDW
jgi:hypothetical protein